MKAELSTGVEIDYEVLGEPDGIPVVFIIGLGAQRVYWPAALLSPLTDAGYKVITFDNRDAGLSTKFESASPPNILAQMALARVGIHLRAPYTLHDMVEDTILLLDHLQISQAHIVGLSMGGMVGQLIAAKHHDRVRTLTTIMSLTNDPALPGPTWTATKALLKRTDNSSADAFAKHYIEFFRAIGSPVDEEETDEWLEIFASAYDRYHGSDGVARQTSAIFSTGDIGAYTRTIKAPTLVIHGKEDPLARPVCGFEIARLVKDSKIKLIDKMGHSLPSFAVPKISAYLLEHFAESSHDHTTMSNEFIPLRD